jgi:hypothetical protein
LLSILPSSSSSYFKNTFSNFFFSCEKFTFLKTKEEQKKAKKLKEQFGWFSYLFLIILTP